MNPLRRTRSQADQPATEPSLPDDHVFGIAVGRDAAGLVAAMRRHPADRWPESHVLRGELAPYARPESASWAASTGTDDQGTGPAWVRVRSTRQPRDLAVREVLDLATDLGDRPVGYAPLDPLDDPPVTWLDHELAAYGALRSVDPTARVPRTLASLRGEAVLQRLLSRAGVAAADDEVGLASARVVGTVVANTAGAGPAAAVAQHVGRALGRGPDGTAGLVALLQGLAWAAELGGRRAHRGIDELPWEALLDAGGRVRGLAIRLHGLARLVPKGQVRAALHADLDAPDPARVVAALTALGVPHDDAALHRHVDELVSLTRSAEVRRAAIRFQAAHHGALARPRWRTLASSSDPADLAVYGELVARHGGGQDVVDAVEAAHRMLRRRWLADGIPPPGGPLLDFLARQRGDVRVDALLVEVGARWDRLPADVQSHLATRGWVR